MGHHGLEEEKDFLLLLLLPPPFWLLKNEGENPLKPPSIYTREKGREKQIWPFATRSNPNYARPVFFSIRRVAALKRLSWK